MALKDEGISRRRFLQTAGATGAGVAGILAFPPGITKVVAAVAPGIFQVTLTYPRVNIVGLADISEGEPVDFAYPLWEHSNFLVKLGTTALDDVDPE